MFLLGEGAENLLDYHEVPPNKPHHGGGQFKRITKRFHLRLSGGVKKMRKGRISP